MQACCASGRTCGSAACSARAEGAPTGRGVPAGACPRPGAGAPRDARRSSGWGDPDDGVPRRGSGWPRCGVTSPGAGTPGDGAGVSVAGTTDSRAGPGASDSSASSCSRTRTSRSGGSCGARAAWAFTPGRRRAERRDRPGRRRVPSTHPRTRYGTRCARLGCRSRGGRGRSSGPSIARVGRAAGPPWMEPDSAACRLDSSCGQDRLKSARAWQGPAGRLPAGRLRRAGPPAGRGAGSARAWSCRRPRRSPPRSARRARRRWSA